MISNVPNHLHHLYTQKGKEKGEKKERGGKRKKIVVLGRFFIFFAFQEKRGGEAKVSAFGPAPKRT